MNKKTIPPLPIQIEKRELYTFNLAGDNNGLKVEKSIGEHIIQALTESDQILFPLAEMITTLDASLLETYVLLQPEDKTKLDWNYYKFPYERTINIRNINSIHGPYEVDFILNYDEITEAMAPFVAEGKKEWDKYYSWVTLPGLS